MPMAGVDTGRDQWMQTPRLPLQLHLGGRHRRLPRGPRLRHRHVTTVALLLLVATTVISPAHAAAAVTGDGSIARPNASEPVERIPIDVQDGLDLTAITSRSRSRSRSSSDSSRSMDSAANGSGSVSTNDTITVASLHVVPADASTNASSPSSSSSSSSPSPASREPLKTAEEMLVKAPHTSSASSSSSSSNSVATIETNTTTASKNATLPGNAALPAPTSATPTPTPTPAPTVPPLLHSVPTHPTLVTATASDGRAEVSWMAPDDDGADPILAYEVAWVDEATNAVVGTQVVTRPGAGLGLVDETVDRDSSANASTTTPVPTTLLVAGLRNGRSYAFRVRAQNRNGFSAWSAKSPPVSPLHPPDLCARVTCSGHGTCFPNYDDGDAGGDDLAAIGGDGGDGGGGRCICRPGYNPPDCSIPSQDARRFTWRVSPWGECSSGCGGGQRTRTAVCVDASADTITTASTGVGEGLGVVDESLCQDKKPSLTRICNGMECGSKLVSVKYKIEMSYDEVLYSAESWAAFERAFTAEVAAALQLPSTRLEVTAIKRGSVLVHFQILPASRVGEKSLNDIVEQLQVELANASSTLRTKGTFARRIEPNAVQLSFSLADQTVAGGAEDISILGLIGTVAVLCSFVALFGWFLRKRHERLHKRLAEENDEDAPKQAVLEAPRSEMRRMGIRTMA